MRMIIELISTTCIDCTQSQLHGILVPALISLIEALSLNPTNSGTARLLIHNQRSGFIGKLLKILIEIIVSHPGNTIIASRVIQSLHTLNRKLYGLGDTYYVRGQPDEPLSILDSLSKAKLSKRIQGLNPSEVVTNAFVLLIKIRNVRSKSILRAMFSPKGFIPLNLKRSTNLTNLAVRILSDFCSGSDNTVACVNNYFTNCDDSTSRKRIKKSTLKNLVEHPIVQDWKPNPSNKENPTGVKSTRRQRSQKSQRTTTTLTPRDSSSNIASRQRTTKTKITATRIAKRPTLDMTIMAKEETDALALLKETERRSDLAVRLQDPSVRLEENNKDLQNGKREKQLMAANFMSIHHTQKQMLAALSILSEIIILGKTKPTDAVLTTPLGMPMRLANSNESKSEYDRRLSFTDVTSPTPSVNHSEQLKRIMNSTTQRRLTLEAKEFTARRLSRKE